MKRFLDVDATLLRWVGYAEWVVAGIILCGVVVTIIAQVALNAGLGNPSPGSRKAAPTPSSG